MTNLSDNEQDVERRQDLGNEPVAGRDPFIDLVRAAALVVVCIWHWAFTVLVWGPTGPSPTSPRGAPEPYS